MENSTSLQCSSLEISESGIALVTLRRPQHLNAINEQLGNELIRIFKQVAIDNKIKVVVVTGEGKAFSAGGDLKDMLNPSKLSEETKDIGGDVSLSIFNCKKPVIAAINGPAIGMGIVITLPMAIRVAGENAKIGFVFGQRGLCPEGCSSWFLPKIVGISKAFEWIYTARIFAAKDEKESGLFNYVVPQDQVLKKALSIAEEIAKTSPLTAYFSNALLWRGMSVNNPKEANRVEAKCFQWLLTQEDFKEGVESFLQKRPPNFANLVETPDFSQFEVQSKL